MFFVQKLQGNTGELKNKEKGSLSSTDSVSISFHNTPQRRCICILFIQPMAEDPNLFWANRQQQLVCRQWPYVLSVAASCVLLSITFVLLPLICGHSGTSPVTATLITFSQRCFSSSDSAAKLCTDFDWEIRKLAGASVGRMVSSTE